MSRRILLVLASVAALILSALVVSPASASPGPSSFPINTGQYFMGEQDPVAEHSADFPLTTSAISANGERVVLASNPRTVNGCEGNTGPIWVSFGVANSSTTTWQSRIAIPLAVAASCGIVRSIQVELSADGSRGIVMWNALPFDAVQNAWKPMELRFATFNWTDAGPPIALDDPQTYSGNGSAYSPELALSSDGSRAVIEFMFGGNPYSVAKYAVIDMDYPNFTTFYDLPVSTFDSAPTFRPAISFDGEVIALSEFRPTGTYGSGPFRELRVFTCQAMCAPSKLKSFSATVPAGQGGYSADLDMNDSGSRIVVTWGRGSEAAPGVTAKVNALRALVIAPLTAPKANIVTSAIQYINTVEVARGAFDLSADGTRFVAGTDHPGVVTPNATGYVKATTGTLSAPGKLTVGKVSNVTDVAASVDSVYFGGNPERVFVNVRNAGARASNVHSMVSDSVAMKNWARMSSEYGVEAKITVAVSSDASRYIVAYDIAQPEQTSQATVRVMNVLNVLGTTVAPSISGATKVGQTLTIKPGTWTAMGTFYYAWFADGVPISDERGSTYVLTPAEAGKRITAWVSNSASGAYYRTVITAPTTIVTGGTFDAPALVLSGLSGIHPNVGAEMSTNTDMWAPSATFIYMWKVGTKVVSRTATYTPVVGDVGKVVTLTVTGTKAGFTPVTKSLSTPVVVRVGIG